jgi:biopolymer transport protein ExbD
MSAPLQRPGELISGINVTPLVDVVLVLLIVLMVTAQYVASQSIPMNLPQAKSSESSQAEAPFAISIDASGTVFLDGERLAVPELQRRLHARPGGGTRSALIAADGSAQHRAVVGVIDVLRSEGIVKLAINVAPESP